MNLKIASFRTNSDFEITQIKIIIIFILILISYFLFVIYLKIITLGSSLSLKGEDKHVQQPGHRCTCGKYFWQGSTSFNVEVHLVDIMNILWLD